MPPRPHYDALAGLFDYPKSDYPARVRCALEAVASRCEPAARVLEAFAAALPGSGDAFGPTERDEIQELFTRSFDVQAITTLGVGYVMFGDDYKRGELLVNLGRELRAVGVDGGTELPDHLPNVLRLMARWPDEELVAEFADVVLHPALSRMIAEFDAPRIAERNRLYEKHYKTLIDSSAERCTLFREPLKAVLAVVRAEFALAEWRAPEVDNDFLRSVGRELDLEDEQGSLVQIGRTP
ncbi:MAG: hypothetical protein K8H90_03495 [Thermoanaerobaculia bacterium]|nr:hypothetical protein [Thermoanaerobaculia bacterium]